MDNLKDWLDSRYLKWQQENGRISIRKWSKVLGISYSLLNNMMAGNNTGTTMQTAYQIGERLMGHADLQVMRRYLAQTDDDLREAHARSSPVDNAM